MAAPHESRARRRTVLPWVAGPALTSLVVTSLMASLQSGSSSAGAVTPGPPAGAPAVESAPASMTGLDPELPPGVIAASAAPGSKWKPENAVYGTASKDDIAIAGAGGTTI